MNARAILATTLLLVLSIGTSAPARTPSGPSAPRAAVVAAARDIASDHRLFSRQLTLQAKSMRDLVEQTAPISRNALPNYQGDWQAYWIASNSRNQRSGKTLEAVLASRANVHRGRLGLPDRMLVTAAEGFPAHAADLVDVAPDGIVLRKYQVKWGWKSTVKALQDPKYEGMRVLTTRESFTQIGRELQAAEATAARRGLPLRKEWQVVRDALDSGRLPGSWSGKHLPSAASVERYSLSHVKKYFAAGANRIAPRAAPKIRELLIASGKVTGKTLIVVDVASMGYFEYADVNRYRSGEIGGGYLTFKSTLRASQLSLAYYAAASPEPATKAVAAFAAGVLVIVDMASDPIYQHAYERRKDAAAMVLASVNRDERYYAARVQLLRLAPRIP